MGTKKFTCERCNFCTAYKCALVKHLESKIPCPTTLRDISREDLKLKLKAPSDRSDEIDLLKRQLEKQQQQIEEQNKQIKELQNKFESLAIISNSNNNTVNSHNTTVNNTNHITVHNFGSENKSYLSKDFLTHCLRRKHSGLLDLVKAIHFDQSHPENHNIRIKNKKLCYIEKLVDKRWQLFDKNAALEELIHQGWEVFDEFQYDNENDLKQSIKPKLLSDVQAWLDKVEVKEKSTIDPLKRDVNLLILNNSYMLIAK